MMFPASAILKFPWERVITVGGGLSSMENLRRDMARKKPATQASLDTTEGSEVIAPALAAPPQSITPPPGLGCTIADNTILARGHLEGLAKGLGGFGVLRVSKDRLEDAAQAAERLGKKDLSERIREIAKILPEIQNQQMAEDTARRLDTIVNESWDLGRRCKGGHVDVGKLKVLAKKVANGTITLNQALEDAKKEGNA